MRVNRFAASKTGISNRTVMNFSTLRRQQTDTRTADDWPTLTSP